MAPWTIYRRNQVKKRNTGNPGSSFIAIPKMAVALCRAFQRRRSTRSRSSCLWPYWYTAMVVSPAAYEHNQISKKKIKPPLKPVWTTDHFEFCIKLPVIPCSCRFLTSLACAIVDCKLTPAAFKQVNPFRNILPLQKKAAALASKKLSSGLAMSAPSNAMQTPAKRPHQIMFRVLTEK